MFQGLTTYSLGQNFPLGTAARTGLLATGGGSRVSQDVDLA